MKILMEKPLTMKLSFLSFFLLSFFSMSATISHPLLELKEFSLPNGMRVCLNKTSFEKEMVYFEVFALGGTSSLPIEDIASSSLAVPILWESGLGDHSSDQLSTYLYEYSIDMKIRINPFDRAITISAPSPQAHRCLHLIKEIFTRPRFEFQAIPHAQQVFIEEWHQKSTTPESVAKDFILDMNLKSWDRLPSLKEPDFSKVDLTKIQAFFKRCFSNPQEFTCVVVGDFAADSLKQALESELNSLPSSLYYPCLSIPPSPSFPAGITKQEKRCLKDTTQALVQITFPIAVEASPNLSNRLKDICELLHAHFISAFHGSIPPIDRLQAKYEFPKFPLIDQLWLSVSFSCSPQNVDLLTGEVLRSLKELKEEEAFEEAVTLCSANRKKKEEIWDQDNGTLLSLIANFYRWRWNLNALSQYLPHPQNSDIPLNKSILKADLVAFTPLDHYSIAIAYPVNWKEEKEGGEG